MAALGVGIGRCCRLLASNICLRINSSTFTDANRLKTLQSHQLVLPRHSSFKSSPIEGPKELYTDFEISNSPEEWKWVERVLRPKIVPEPKPKSEYPSGWRPPSDAAPALPYYVKRNRNHMLPLYLRTSHRGMRRITVINNIQGDIWMLERELREYLEHTIKKSVITMVHEVCCSVKVKGDVYLPVEKWLYERGF